MEARSRCPESLGAARAHNEKGKHMAISARFFVSEITRQPGAAVNGRTGVVKLRPAYANGANKEWAVATPSGEMWMTVNNPEAFAEFEAAMDAGDDLHITFERHPRAQV